MLRYADGFGHWGSDANFNAYAGYSPTGGFYRIVNDATRARTGNYFLYIQPNGGNVTMCDRMIGGNNAMLIMGVAIYLNTATTNEGWGVRFYGANTGEVQVACNIKADGSLVVTRGATILGTSNPNAFTYNSFSYIEMLCVCDDTNGTVIVRVNGATVLSITGVDTANQAYAYMNGFGFGKMNGLDNNIDRGNRFADLYCLDSDVSGAHNFIGDIRCRTILPNAVGAQQDWTANGAANTFDCIDNVPFDPAKYISTPTVGAVSTFGLTDVPTNTSQVAGVMVFGAVNKTDAGTCEVKLGVNSNGSVASIAPVNPGVGPAYYYGPIQNDPDGGGPWTYPKVNALLGRVERSA